MPNPVAEFSALAITRSDLVLLDQRAQALAHQLASGLADDVADEEDVHPRRCDRSCAGAASVTGMRCGCCGGRRASGSTTVSSPSRSAARARGDVEGAVQADGAREAAELALDEVERLLRPGRLRRLLAGDDEDAGAEEHAERVGGHARDVDDDFDRVVGFEHVERRDGTRRSRPADPASGAPRGPRTARGCRRRARVVSPRE